MLQLNIDKKASPIKSYEDIFDIGLASCKLTYSDLDLEIRKGFTKLYSQLAKDPDVTDEYFINNLVDYCSQSPLHTLSSLDKESLVFYNELSSLEKQRFLFFSGSNFIWDYVIGLTENIDWQEKKHSNSFTKTAQVNFPLLISFIRSLPFKYIGRVVVLGVAPHQKIYRHRDSRRPNKETNFLLMNFMQNEAYKILSVIDSSGAIWHQSSRCISFDDSLDHFCEAKPYFTYSVRVDGIFSFT